MLNKIKSRLPAVSLPSGLNKTQLLAIAGGAVLALAIILSLWNRNQGYVALYGSQEHLPVSQVVEVLGAENIPYRINPDNGQILIGESKLSQARMALAAKGISAVTPDGYELMDKEEMLGSSQFIQNVRYKRSMEGELAKSIMALDAVENARVHLGISESSSFVLANKPGSSASVMVQLRYGKKLDEQQVGSIVQLVSGSVPGLQPASVRVVDQEGNLLSAGIEGPDGSLAGSRAGNDAVQRIRNDISQNIASLLTSLVGAGNFRISVAPDVNLSRVEETQERLGKDPRVSDEQISQENTTNEMAFGIPGSLSNRPVNQAPQAAAAQAAGTQAAADATAGAATNADPRSLSSRSQQQRKYAFDRDIRHIRHPAWKLEKLNVAVALNQTAPALAKITPEQLTSMTRLVESAAGIEKSRGDVLTLDVLAFTTPEGNVIPELKWWQDPAMQYWGQNGGIGLLALLTLLFGVRPLAQRFGRRGAVTIEGEAEKEKALLAGDTIATEQSLATGLAKVSFNNDDNLPPQSSGLETKVEYLQMLAQSETERVADVLKQWINSNERSTTKPE